MIMGRGPRGVAAVLRISREVVWSSSFGSMMGRILGALALISLMRYAFDFGLSAAAREVLSHYNEALRVALGWLDPYVRSLALDALHAIGIEAHFSEFWRHIFVLMQILFVRDAGVAFFDRRPLTGSFRLLIGILISMAVSLLAALTFFQLSNLAQNILFAVLPTAGIYIYDVILYIYSAMFQINYLNKIDGLPERSRKGFLKSALARGTRRFLLGLSVTCLCLLVPGIGGLSAPAGGLIAIAVATIANASYWLWRGGKFASEQSKLGQPWIDAFKQSEAGRFGIAVTSVFVWIGVFATLNAGMKQLGL